MTAKPEDLLLQAWKQQLDLGLRLVETIVEGSIKLREMQVKAAADAHADAVTTRKSLADATSLAQLVKLQSDWTRANAEKCAAYWRELYEVAAHAGRTGAQPPAATQKSHGIAIGKRPEDRTGAEPQPAPVKAKPSRRAHAQGAQ
jgi:phasin family protein